MLTLGAWLHDLDPFVIRFTETFGIRWYGLAYVAGFACAWLLLRWLARRGSVLIRPEAVGDFIMAVVIGTLVGGRVGYALFYQPALFITFSDQFPWWGLLAINKGGMASHGGVIGIILGCVWFARREKLDWLHVTDCASLLAPAGIFFGRIANFINGELLGAVVARPGEPAPWWAVKFPQELIERAPELTEEQQIELHALLLRHAAPGDSQGDAVDRLLAALQASEPGVAEQLAPLISARHPSQLYQAVAEGVVLLMALWLIWAKPRRAGVVSAWFVLLYGVGRILTETIRLPDANVWSPRIAGLSRGQWLSVAMVIVGVVVLWRGHRRGAERIGGWLQKNAPAPKRDAGAQGGS